MPSPNYSENPEHYKQLISTINEEANFPMYLYQNGYQLIAKSTCSMEFRNDKDRIVLQVNRNPITYFNRNDSCDKGLFFKYLMRRSPNFFQAIQIGLEIAGRTYSLENKALETQKNNTLVKSLEENYNIVPLRNSTYLRVQRGISRKTLNNELFKGRIFNAYHVSDHTGKIANTAFPKYDLEGNAKNYILYNKPFRRKKDNEIKKFRLVLNQKDHFLFHSKPVRNPSKIVIGESGIDLLSYHELHGKPDNFYVSFGGNVYPKKLQFLVQLTEPLLDTQKTTLVSIMDNDLKGHEFDLKLFTTVINQYNPNIKIETSFQSANASLNIHYAEKLRGKLTYHTTMLNEKLTSDIQKDNPDFASVRCAGLSDKIFLEFDLKEMVSSSSIHQKKNMFHTLLKTITALYLPFRADIHKSHGKDWNDDLRASKKVKYVRMVGVVPKTMAIGDTIQLKTSKGPEGTTNIGRIKAVNSKSLECDFGLNYTYAIPYSAIQAHFKKSAARDIEQDNENRKMNSKNNNLQNILS